MTTSGTTGHWIQRFEVIDQLGAGSMGTVYRARDPQLGREVAIKVLARPSDGVRDELVALDAPAETIDLRGQTATGELLAEARMMARLSHPNVLPVYEAGLDAGGVFLVMEHIAGCDLRTWLDRPRSAREILDVFAQAAGGLAAAHREGIVHGDFKPENVLVGDDGRVRVADFGLSRLTVNTAPPVRVEPAIAGTPLYMAPELWRGEAATARSDVFALCTALSEALAGTDRIGRRLRGVIERGVAEDPEARPELAEVTGALASRATWRVPAAVAAIGIAAAGAAALVLGGDAPAPCAADGARLVDGPDPARRAVLAEIGVADRLDRRRARLVEALREACDVEQRGELTLAQARSETACIERRAIELDAVAGVIAGGPLAAQAAQDAIGDVLPVDDCVGIEVPPLPADRRPIAALYRRWTATFAMAFASPERTAALAAVERDARALGDRELEARASVSLGMRQIETDQLDAADASFARGHARAQEIHATGVMVEALVERGIAAEMAGDAKAAHSYSQLALQLAERPGTGLPTRVFVYWAVGRADLARGEPEDAARLLEKALAILKDQVENPAREVSVRFALIAALHQLGDHARALELARETVEVSRRAHGEDDADHGIAINVLAIALRYAGDPAAALDHRRRALAVMTRAFPPEHSVILGQRMNIANDLFANGRFEEARAEAAAMVELTSRNERTRTFRPTALADLGAITFATGRHEEGLRLFEQGLEEMISQDGQDHPDVLDYRVQRVDLEIELGRLDDAERHADALERSYRERGDRARDQALLDGIERAEIALARGDGRGAEARTRAALAGWKELKGEEGDRADLLRLLGESLVEQRRWTEALEALAAAAVIAGGRKEGPERLLLIDVQKARALAGMGRRTEAITLAGRVRDALERFPSQLRARAAADRLLGRAPRP